MSEYDELLARVDIAPLTPLGEEFVHAIRAQSKRIAELESELKRTRAALDIAREYLDDHSDCVDGDYGVPAPNDAMKCLQEINEAMEAKS